MNDELRNIKSIKDLRGVFVNLFPIFYKGKNKIGIFSMCAYRIPIENKNDDFKKYMNINNTQFKLQTLFKKGIGLKVKKYMYYINVYRVSINTDELTDMPVQNVCFIDLVSDKTTLTLPIVYNAIYYKNYLGKTGLLYKYKGRNLVCYFRQTKMNSIGLTIRENNVTDNLFIRFKIHIAHFLSLITPKSNVILLYEKESNKYEESASMVYERLIDLGYDNAKYIIRKSSKHNEFIKDKYKKNIIYAFTFKHFYTFFKCHKFIGTETVPHSIELRAKCSVITRKMIKKNYKQVFLQHGVMYMVALNPTSRGAFLKGGNEMPNDAKIVVSSELEKKHFIDLGGFAEEDLYVTGLPFYDRTKKNKDADKITIMLTWRSWEYNILRSNYKKSPYYQMVKSILDNIPKEYKDKVYVLPHPLILEQFKQTDLVNMIPNIISYDKILEETSLLITDYSSIAYSAFYRGSNVIFAWEQLDECMKNYKSHLMLNKTNVFGDVSYEYKDINNLVKINYLKPQDKLYIKRYKQIVEFDDNKNTDRLIEKLKEDGII